MKVMCITFLLPVEDETDATNVATAIKEGEYELDTDNLNYVISDLHLSSTS